MGTNVLSTGLIVLKRKRRVFYEMFGMTPIIVTPRDKSKDTQLSQLNESDIDKLAERLKTDDTDD